MNDEASNRFDPDRLRLDIGEVRAVVPERLQKRAQQFAKFPLTWVSLLGRGRASYPTWVTASHILHLDWKNQGRPFKLPNGLLKIDGVSPSSKLRALRELECLGLISVEWRQRKSPIVRKLI
jgi:hypothetical protein